MTGVTNWQVGGGRRVEIGEVDWGQITEKDGASVVSPIC